MHASCMHHAYIIYTKYASYVHYTCIIHARYMHNICIIYDPAQSCTILQYPDDPAPSCITLYHHAPSYTIPNHPAPHASYIHQICRPYVFKFRQSEFHSNFPAHCICILVHIFLGMLHHTCIIHESYMHHKCTMHASCMHLTCIRYASHMHNKCSCMHDKCIINASCMHHRYIIHAQ